MPKPAKPRKKHSFKGITMPVTQALVDDLGSDLHFSLMALENGAVTAENWKRIGKVLFIVSIASDAKDIDRADKVAIDSSVLILKSMSDYEVRHRVWRATDLDLTGLRRGALAAERTLPKLDYRALAAAYSAFVRLTKTIQ